MKTVISLFFTFCAIFFVAISARAQLNMVIHLANGDSVSYSVDSLESMKLTPTEWPHYNAVQVFDAGPPPTYPTIFYGSNIDSITISKDSVGFFNLNFALDTNNGNIPYTSFRITSHVIRGLGESFDSITFSEYAIDTNIIQLPITYFDTVLKDTVTGQPFGTAWIGNRIYYSPPPGFWKLDSNLNLVSNLILNPALNAISPIGTCSLTPDSDGNHLLSVTTWSDYVGFDGTMEEFGTQSGSSIYFDTPYVSSAVYYRGGDDTIIYYTYGDWSDTTPNPPNAGYYFFDRKANTKTLLLHYISDLGPIEMVNGFDVSPDGKKLLIGATSQFRAPLVIEYDLAFHTFDTIPVVFDTATLNPALWVRYSHDGTKILYSNYPFNTFSHYDEVYQGEIGIIDRATGFRRTLSANPTTEGYWDCIFPEWSPDDHSIVYSAAPSVAEPPGIGPYRICILKTLQ